MFGKPEEKYLRQARTLYFDKSYEEAIAFYDKVLEKNPTHVEALTHKALCYSILNKFEETMVCYGKLLEIKPNDEGAMFAMSREQEKFELFEEALATLDKIITIYPHPSSYIMTAKANVLLKVGKYEEALDICKKSKSPSTEDLVIKSTSLSKLGRYDEALAAANKVIPILESESRDLVSYSDNKIMLKDMRKIVVTWYEKSLKTNPNDVDMLYKKGVLEELIGLYSAANATFAKILGINPKHYGALQKLRHCVM